MISNKTTTPALCAETLDNPLNTKIKANTVNNPKEIEIIKLFKLYWGILKNKTGIKNGIAIKFCQNVNETLSYFLKVLDKT